MIRYNKTMPPIQPTPFISAASAFEQGLPLAARLRNGQYFTPTTVCDFMIALIQAAVHPHHETSTTDSNETRSPWQLLEPGCGPGSFLSRYIHRLENQTRLSSDSAKPVTAQKHCLNPLPSVTLHGIELDPEAAALAQGLLPASSPGYTTQIHTLNFISPSVDALGPFDWIIGNPPYVRQEHIAQSTQIDKSSMRAYLQEKYTNYLEQYPEQFVLFSQTADLYLWFFLQATSLLKPGGRLAFVTSNSWLNTAYGQPFQHFLTDHFHICTLAESACERWFPDAAINAIILVLEKKKTPPNNKPSHKPKKQPLNKTLYASTDTDFRQPNPVQLIRLKTPLSHWLPKGDASQYWEQLDAQLSTASLRTDPTIQHTEIAIEQLQSGMFKTQWALPLRASSELIDLLSQPELWQPLDHLGRLRYPLKTGINAFFYLNREKAEQWQIEPEFLFPVLRSSRQVKGYQVTAEQVPELLFSCPLTLEELAEQGKTGALTYIVWGESQSAPARQKRAKATPWPQVPSVQGNRPWHYTKPLPTAHILCPRFIDQRFFFPLCIGELMEDQTFYGLTVAQPEPHPPELIAAILNGTLSFLIAEYSARTNLGEGVLQFSRGDMARLPLLRPDSYTPTEQSAILQTFAVMRQRPLLPLAEELFSPDRVALDVLLLNPVIRKQQAPSQPTDIARQTLDLRDRLAHQLLTRVQERQALAKSTRRPTARQGKSSFH